MDKSILDIFGFDVVDNILYFNAMNVNGIFSMDIDTGKVKYKALSEKYYSYNGYLYRDAKVDNGKIWFSPYVADEILVYDLKRNDYEYINIPPIKGHGRHTVKFGEIYDYGDWFILIPMEYPALLKVNKKTHEVIAVNWEKELLKQYPNFIEDNGHISIASDYEIHNETMYLLAENTIIRYNMRTDCISVIKINNSAALYSGIVRYANGFALVERDQSEFLVWDERINRVEKKDYDLGYRGNKASDDSGPTWVFKVNEGIVIAQAKSHYLILIKETGATCKIDLDIKKSGAKELLYSQVKQKVEKLYFPLNGLNSVLIVNTDNWSQQCVEMNFDDFERLTALVEEDNYIIENTIFYELSDLINKINQCDKQGNAAITAYDIGETIYQSII